MACNCIGELGDACAECHTPIRDGWPEDWLEQVELWRRPVVMMLRANAAYRGKSLSRDQYVDELEEAMTVMVNSQLRIEELQKSEKR